MQFHKLAIKGSILKISLNELDIIEFKCLTVSI